MALPVSANKLFYCFQSMFSHFFGFYVDFALYVFFLYILIIKHGYFLIGGVFNVPRGKLSRNGSLAAILWTGETERSGVGDVRLEGCGV